METFIADENGHVGVPGCTATYPVGYTVYFLHGHFAGMEPPVPQEGGPTQPLQGDTDNETTAQQ